MPEDAPRPADVVQRGPEWWEDTYRRDPDAWYFGREPSELARLAGKYWKLLHGERQGERRGAVVDLGAGEGRDAVHFTQLGFDVTAVEVSAAGIEKAQRLAANSGITIHTLLQADVREFTLPAQFSLLVCNNVLQFLATECIPHLRKLQAATPPGAMHAVSVFTRESEHLAGRADLYRFDRNELKFHYQEGWRLLYYGEEILWREPSHALLSFARIIAIKEPPNE